MKMFDRVFGDQSDRYLKKIRGHIATINALEEGMVALSDEELCAKTSEFRERLKKGSTVDDILDEAFAVVREAARRTLGQRHYDVQLLGGITLHEGNIAEMHTGEGKTLVATLPVYLNALTGKGVHVITVNDYLARRDAAWMGQIYAFLGLSLGVINNQTAYLYDPTHVEMDEDRDEQGSFKVFYDFLKPCTRREAYVADITYGTNSEFGFDYLRDNLAYREEELSQRSHAYAVVDEIDSILIDEARTPLIISSPTVQSDDLYLRFASIATTLVEGDDFTKDEKTKQIALTEDGIEKAEHAIGVSDIYTEKGIKYVHHLETATRARAHFERDRDYVVKDGEVIIVDQFTGRLQPGRRWSEGLHQAIEAKEGVRVQEESRTFATISYQNYFRLYKRLSGMTGTAETSKEEFTRVYGLDVVRVPTNRPIVRIDNEDLIFQTEHGKWQAISAKLAELNKKGQPVLVGTVSIEKSELLSGYLKASGVPHEVLNAKQHEREGELVAQAGRRGRVTIATNMAGRGVDIKLGGALAERDVEQDIKDRGGLFVLGTERHEARRIDNQLRGRAGRQGDPGETQFYLSLEDSLMRVFAGDRVKKMMGTFGIPEDHPIQSRIVSRTVEASQTKVEGFNFDARKHLLEYDNVMNTQRKAMYGRRRNALVGSPKEVEELLEEVATHLEEEEQFRAKVASFKKDLGEDPFMQVFRRMYLQVIDMLWVEHLETMEHLRSSVRLRAYGQRDPLVEYKREARGIFTTLEASLFVAVGRAIDHIVVADQAEQKELQDAQDGAMRARDQKHGEASVVSSKSNEPGRNDPCYCGSGKKYKKCHGK
ncbi:MAG: preprotein translocase subunit SecA [bacterium]|nr:preprotein translocase subunit SecA [bacterium]